MSTIRCIVSNVEHAELLAQNPRWIRCKHCFEFLPGKEPGGLSALSGTTASSSAARTFYLPRHIQQPLHGGLYTPTRASSINLSSWQLAISTSASQASPSSNARLRASTETPVLPRNFIECHDATVSARNASLNRLPRPPRPLSAKVQLKVYFRHYIPQDDLPTSACDTVMFRAASQIGRSVVVVALDYVYPNSTTLIEKLMNDGGFKEMVKDVRKFRFIGQVKSMNKTAKWEELDINQHHPISMSQLQRLTRGDELQEVGRDVELRMNILRETVDYEMMNIRQREQEIRDKKHELIKAKIIGATSILKAKKRKASDISIKTEENSSLVDTAAQAIAKKVRQEVDIE